MVYEQQILVFLVVNPQSPKLFIFWHYFWFVLKSLIVNLYCKGSIILMFLSFRQDYIISIYRIDHLFCIVFTSIGGNTLISTNRYNKFIKKVDKFTISNLLWYYHRSLICTIEGIGMAAIPKTFCLPGMFLYFLKLSMSFHCVGVTNPNF